MATAGDTQLECGVIALAVAQKPRPLPQRPGLRLLGGDPVLPSGGGVGHAMVRHPGHPPTSVLLSGNQIQGPCVWGRTRSIRMPVDEEENHIQGALREGREPHPALMREENQNRLYALNRRKAALFNRRQQDALAVVFCQRADVLLYDRPLPGQPGRPLPNRPRSTVAVGPPSSSTSIRPTRSSAPSAAGP